MMLKDYKLAIAKCYFSIPVNTPLYFQDHQNNNLALFLISIRTLGCKIRPQIRAPTDLS